MLDEKAVCPACGSGRSNPYCERDGYRYFSCSACGTLHIEPHVLAQLDEGVLRLGRGYDEAYWREEEMAARERADGCGLVRAGESILYCRRAVNRFLDIGAGPGFLLEELQRLLDPDRKIFHGVERFPPPRSVGNTNLHAGDLSSLPADLRFDAGVCIEVIEHLTPSMFRDLARGLARVSEPGSFWLFNTGMPAYVRNEDPGYLDPVSRGHIVSYSLEAARLILEPCGFRVGSLPGKSYAFYAEYAPDEADVPFDERIYRALPANVALLRRCELLWQAAFEAARSAFYYQGYLERTQWALDLQRQLEARPPQKQVKRRWI